MYQWEQNGFWMTDGNAWVNGVNFGCCPKEVTGETVVLSSRNPEFGSWCEQISVECQIFRVDMQQSFAWSTENPERYVYIAIGQYKYAPILFRDELTFDAYFRFVNREKEG